MENIEEAAKEYAERFWDYNKGGSNVRISGFKAGAEYKSKIDIYSGELNTERIKQYKKLAELYNVQESTVRDIFCKGADWALKL